MGRDNKKSPCKSNMLNTGQKWFNYVIGTLGTFKLEAAHEHQLPISIIGKAATFTVFDRKYMTTFDATYKRCIYVSGYHL